ncbi:ABC transporter ATP-binding protein [Pusillimonas noertemannii]|uniref:Peptide/nickel transport system ATP-binding protein n=2 Tax=Pusillimonas noertemannii TaxID=305977 RepID=A0A2U1CJ64_9BURK|nr:ABC transporter ATP-binding protein [Pusillimonas noertemannii]NYT70103.1 ABC transporter ATP-binding protein [Pusillimonas noertemannii]PVY61049.1 peptide/nickel transport system ATP-binding protein [Pusillimonas noertemannii]TFL08299.1 ABC transporter ATP-binding protein [Pusillimonas noertemannii]
MSRHHNPPVDASAPTLQVEGLNVAVRGGPALLRAVSLTVQPGEVRALVGESGAGKSMIGKAVLGVLPRGIEQASGSIRLQGASLEALSPAARRQTVASVASLIPQDPLTALNPSRRIGGQITDRLVRRLGWSSRDAHARALELLDRVYIRDPARVMAAYPHELSGGMRQRVLIAAAFAPRPSLIVADEPTTALDVTVQKQILQLIRELQAETGTAVLFVTHDMGVVAKVSQTVTVLFDGKVMEDAPTAQLLAQPGHPYTRALIAATPRYTHPHEPLRPVPDELVARLRQEVARGDANTAGATRTAA